MFNARYRRGNSPDSAPEVNDEDRLYQILVAIWPAPDPADAEPAAGELVERIAAYMNKAVREAQRRTSWMRPEPEYEDAVRGFVRGILESEDAGEFRR